MTKEQAFHNKGMRIDCDHCAIACTHAMIVAIFDSKEDK